MKRYIVNMTTKSTEFKVKNGSYSRPNVYRGNTPILSCGASSNVPGVCNSLVFTGISAYKSSHITRTLRTAMKVLLQHYSGYALVMAVVRSDQKKDKLFDPKLWNKLEGYPGNYYRSQGMYTLDVFVTNPSYLKKEGKI